MNTPSSTYHDRQHLIFYLVAVGLVFYLLWLYLPFANQPYIVNTDRDALSIIGEIRATSQFTGWPNGFYINSLLIGLVTHLLNATELAYNDYAQAYQYVIVMALIGLGLGSYALIYLTTRSIFISLSFTVCLTLTPGLIRLAGQAEDNLISALFHLQYFGIFSWYVMRQINKKLTLTTWWPEIFLGLSLTVGCLAHHQLNTLWITPLSLLLFLYRGLPLQSLVKRVAAIYTVSIALFLSSYVILTIAWAGRFEPGLYARWVLQWFVPNSFYQNYYFFNRFGWDLTQQAAEIGAGISQIVRVEPSVNLWIYGAYLVILLLLARSFINNVTKTPQLGVAVMFVLIHIPHSLVYESSSLERWDIIIIPIGVALAITTWLASRAAAFGRWRLGGVVSVLAVITLVNVSFYQYTLADLHSQSQQPIFQALNKQLLASVTWPTTAPRQRQVLILSDEAFNRYFMIAHNYYNHRSDIYGLTNTGELYRSPALFPQKAPVSRQEFLRETIEATLVGDSDTLTRLRTILGTTN